mgnify:CR=1 FL=1
MKKPDDVAVDYCPDLQITFCGIRCENPFFLASSAVCTNYEMVARAFDAGWAGVFYKTICLQEIKEVSPRFDAKHSNGIHGDFYGFRNMEQLSENPVETDFDILRRLKLDYPTKVVVASIMGQTKKEWISLAKMAEAVHRLRPLLRVVYGRRPSGHRFQPGYPSASHCWHQVRRLSPLPSGLPHGRHWCYQANQQKMK